MRNDHAHNHAAHGKTGTSNRTPRKNVGVTTGAGPLKPVPTAQPNEGEGNRTAARHYDTATEAYIASGRSEAAAKAAADALDGPEAEELRAAEEAGKAGHPSKKG